MNMGRLRALGASALRVGLTAVVAASIWTFSVIAASGYLDAAGIEWREIAAVWKEFATPVGVLIAALAFSVNTFHQRYAVHKDRQRHHLDMALGWVEKAVEVVEHSATAADKEQPFYSAVSSLQLKSAADLLGAAEQSAADLRELRFQRRYEVEARYASSKLLQVFRFRGTSQFFDLRYYHAVQLALRGKDVLVKEFNSSFNLAFYHNDSIELFDEYEGGIEDLKVDESIRKDLRRFGLLLNQLRKGQQPFGHPFLGSTIPLDAAESILRFTLRKPPGTPPKDLFPDEDAPLRWSMIGLEVLLFQCRYFGVAADGKVFNTLEPKSSASSQTPAADG